MDIKTQTVTPESVARFVHNNTGCCDVVYISRNRNFLSVVKLRGYTTLLRDGWQAKLKKPLPAKTSWTMKTWEEVATIASDALQPSTSVLSVPDWLKI